MAEQKDKTASELAGLMRSLKELSATMQNVKKTDVAPVLEPQPAGFEQAADAPGYGLPPIYANRFNLWANDQIVRFIIGNSISGNDLHYKMSFVMTRADAADLANTIITLLKDTEPKATTEEDVLS